MRELIDECLPRRLVTALAGVDAQTVPDAGWAGKSNGELIALAETEFDVFVTIDQNLVHQQILVGRQLAVAILVATSNRFATLAPLVPAALEALRTIRPGDLVRVRE